jgi:uncharacterized protein YndB with AHSA1/START domain
VNSSIEQTLQTINLVKELEIAAPIDIAWEAVLDELGPESQMPGGQPFPFTLEPWPGGRWFRDLGNETGHLWGHVQVIKPPALIEICGPLFMSYPGTNFVQYRLSPVEGSGGERTRLKLTHRAMGLIPREDREGVESGWSYGLDRIAELAQRKLSSGTRR